MNFSLSVVFLFALVSQPAFSATLAYENAPFPMGGRRETSLSEQGFTTSGRFTHSGTQNPDRSSNASTGFLNVIDGDQAIVRVTDGSLFNAIAIDLAEYSVVFRFPARIELFGQRADGVTVSTVFPTDGLFDGPGGIEDFQRLVFPDSFNNLQSLYTKTISLNAGDHPFSFDDVTVNIIPEPGSELSFACGVLVLALARRQIRRLKVA